MGHWAAMDQAAGQTPVAPLSWLEHVPIEGVRVGDRVLIEGLALPVLDMRTLYRRPGITPGKHLIFPGRASLLVPSGQTVQVRRGIML